MPKLPLEKTDWLAAAQHIKDLAICALLTLALSTMLQVLGSKLHDNWLSDLMICAAAASTFLHGLFAVATAALMVHAWKYALKNRRKTPHHKGRTLGRPLRRTTILTLYVCLYVMTITTLLAMLVLMDNETSPALYARATSKMLGFMLFLSASLCLNTREYHRLALILDEIQHKQNTCVAII